VARISDAEGNVGVDGSSGIEASGGIDVSDDAIDQAVYARRWWILGVLCLSLLIVGIDGTIVNVALPSLVRELGASSSELQWIVDAYTLVFASFLLLAGSTGDRHGRKPALIAGLLIFGAGSLASALAGSAGVLIGTRAIQGFGAAFIMPSTLSILTNVFPSGERGRAIGIWAGISGVGVAIGPITGGYLLEHYWWGSIFLVNVPIIAVALVATLLIVPNSRDRHAPRLDLLGTALSVAMLVTLLYGIIEGPNRGWTDGVIMAAFAIGAVLLVAFVLWEAHSDHPMLDVSFFKNPRFSAASAAVTLVFFSMFGALFFLSQYLQFVLGYDALASGVRLLPVALALVVAAPLSSSLVARFGTKYVVTGGLVLVAAAMTIFSRVTTTSGYGLVAVVLVVIGLGMGLAMAPATDSIMGSLPPDKAGVGSAVNDTTREVGGALGVAILGSITASSYRSTITASPVYAAASEQSAAAAAAIKDSVGGAAEVAQRVPAAAATALTDTANAAFVHALSHTVLVAAAIALVGALVALVFLPSRPLVPGDELDDIGDAVVVAAQRLPADGRRRDVTGAVFQLLAEAGFSSLTFNGVATRSGVSTATLGRYWGSRIDMVVDAVRVQTAEVTIPDTGSFRVDAEHLLATMADALSDPANVQVVSQLTAAAARDPALAEALRTRFLAPRRAALGAMIERGMERGELPADTDRSVLADLLVAPIYHRALISGDPLDHDLARRIVDAVMGRAPQAPSA
jgi:EmrB/QacA subfamily drug resistance transporter